MNASITQLSTGSNWQSATGQFRTVPTFSPTMATSELSAPKRSAALDRQRNATNPNGQIPSQAKTLSKVAHF